MATPNVQSRDYMEAFRRAFAGPEHRPFHRKGERRAALLLHGLVGTPAEMRPLAEQLHQMGWTVDVPLLPGHGSEIDRLFETGADAWAAKVRESLDRLCAAHSPVVVVGHSVGGALALQIVAEHANGGRPDGLVLISPFIRLPLDSVWLRIFGPLLRLVVTHMRPFKDLDFDAGPNREEIRAGILEFMPELDIDDPQVQAQIRQVEVPTRLLGELARLGKRARQVAGCIHLPTLLLQGLEDEVARPAYTRHLLTQLGGRVSYHEFAAAHNLVRVQGPAWPEVAEAVMVFCGRFPADGDRQPVLPTVLERTGGLR
jgi:carboxylesterase